MAEVSNRNSELTAFSGRLRIMGLNNDIFNTNDLVEAEITAIDAEIKPVENKRALMEAELEIWKEYSVNISDFTKSLEGLTKAEFNSKVTSYGTDGYFEIKPPANAVEGKYSINVERLASNHQISSDKVPNIKEPLSIDDVVTINGKELQIDAGMSLRDVVASVNNGSYGVSASIISDRLVLTSKETGTDANISLGDGGNGALKTLGLVTDTGEIKNTLTEAVNAKYYINGIEGESQSNMITDGLDGSELTLFKVTAMPINAEIKSDVDKVVGKVKEFVDAYNKMADSQKYFTSEGATLQGQSTPLGVRNSLGKVTGYVSESGNRLYEMGVSIDKNGKLSLDEEMLKKSYEEKPDMVHGMMFGEKGVAQYMKNNIDKYVGENGILTDKISSMDKSIGDLQEQITKFDDMYAYRTEALYNKYSEFESKMSSLNFQLTYMEAQMEALSGKKE